MGAVLFLVDGGMKTLFCLLSFSQILWAAEPHALSGSWTFQDSHEPERQLSLHVKIEPEELVLLECSANISSQGVSCLNFKYRIKNEEIFDGLRKVGDLFPHALVVFDSNSQRSEMVKLSLRTWQDLEYTYSYSNMEGEGDFRKAKLKRSVMFNWERRESL